MIQPTAKRLPWGHISCWAIYLFVFYSLPHYGDMANYGQRDWLMYVYRFAAGVPIFYITAHFARIYIERHYIDFVMEDSYRKKALLLMKRPVFAIVLLAGAYVTVTLLLENKVYGPGEGDIVLRVKENISGALKYILAAMFYALIRWPGPQGGDSGGPRGGGEDGGQPIIRYKVFKPLRTEREKVG